MGVNCYGNNCHPILRTAVSIDILCKTFNIGNYSSVEIWNMRRTKGHMAQSMKRYRPVAETSGDNI